MSAVLSRYLWSVGVGGWGVGWCYLESGPQTSVLYTDRSASYYEAETAQQTLSSTKNRKIMTNFKALQIQVQIYGAFLKKYC